MQEYRRQSVKNYFFREVIIPGDLLDDENISDGAKLLYGKIARLAYKTGFCWASNKFLDGTQTGSTAKRQIKELIDGGYIKAVYNEQSRQLFICTVDSRIKKDIPRPDTDTPQTKNDHPPDQKQTDPQTKNDHQTIQDITNLNKQKKETEDFSPDDKPIECKEDATKVFNRARNYWNERKLKPECRDIMMRPADTPEILRTMQHYTWEEIKNAIGNYAWHKTKAGSEYAEPPPYGSLAGFLKTGVERYFDDNALDQQFKRDKK